MSRIVLAADGEESSRVEDQIQVYALVGSDATVTVVEFNGTQFTGEAKRAPGDPFDSAIAEALSLGRALELAGLYYQALAENGIDCGGKH